MRGRGGEPLADLALHHHEHPLDRPARRRAGRRRAAWRRCTAGWRRAPPASGPMTLSQSSVIASASTRARSACSATTSRSAAASPRSTSTASDVGAGLGQRQGQRAEAGADLDDAVTRADPGEVGDAPHGVGVGDEVLAEITPRREVAFVEQFADPRPRMCHERSLADLDVDRRRGQLGDALEAGLAHQQVPVLDRRHGAPSCTRSTGRWRR